jgi:hypothetical protein
MQQNIHGRRHLSLQKGTGVGDNLVASKLLAILLGVYPGVPPGTPGTTLPGTSCSEVPGMIILTLSPDNTTMRCTLQRYIVFWESVLGFPHYPTTVYDDHHSQSDFWTVSWQWDLFSIRRQLRDLLRETTRQGITGYDKKNMGWGGQGHNLSLQLQRRVSRTPSDLHVVTRSICTTSFLAGTTRLFLKILLQSQGPKESSKAKVCSRLTPTPLGD